MNDLSQLVDEARTCTACPLHRQRKQVAIYRGVEAPEILWVGQSPGEDEDRVGLPFVGRSGQLLHRMLAQHGLVDVSGFINVVNCHPAHNLYLPTYAVTCRGFLERKLSHLSPKMIVSVGKDADRALEELWEEVVGRKEPPGFISVLRGYVHHPSYILRNGGDKESNPSYRDWQRQFVHVTALRSGLSGVR
jgi:DNA polymerase